MVIPALTLSRPVQIYSELVKELIIEFEVPHHWKFILERSSTYFLLLIA